jgi:uncharacterized protein YndB with AHSA1/START domain
MFVMIKTTSMTTQDNIQETMKKQETKSFKYSFESVKPQEEVFKLLLEIDKWWSGLFEETITGESHRLNDEFSFKAGGGVHYSKQKLVELVPNERIVWLVTESHLSFLKDTNEWANTKIRFDMAKEGTKTKVTFTHEGLVPNIECFDSCSGAWTQYMENLEAKLK